MATKPATKPDWTRTNPTARVEPSGSKKENGWDPNERPPREFMNWLFYSVGVEWLDYFEEVTDGLISLQSTYDVVVGVGGTHATLNDAIADASLGDNLRVLVQDPATLTATQVLSKNGWEIVFKPRAIYSQGAATTPGIQVTGDRVKLVGGRFTDFDGGSDVAIQIDGENCRVQDCNFLNCDVSIQDNATNTLLTANLDEV